MLIHILTLFPNMFRGPFDESIIHRAREKGLVKIKIHNLRDWATDERGTVDDLPFGGGPGMVLKPEPIFAAVEEILGNRHWALGNSKEKETSAYSLVPSASTILLTPQGKLFNQKTAKRLSKLENLILICGHYEGVDERVREHLVDEEISIGDYILTGGELPAMVVTDAIVRLIPGVLNKEGSDSFSCYPERITNKFVTPLLEHPQYTRPEAFRGFKVPEILLSGNHQEIKKWREKQREDRTRERRPDLI